MKAVIIGSAGRFARAFRHVLGLRGEVDSISFSDLISRRISTIDFQRFKKTTDVIWAAGPGTAHAATQSKEIEALQIFLTESVKLQKEFPRFHYLSTGGSMYGENSGRVFEDALISPVGVHGVQKQACEDLIACNFQSTFNNINILRLANAYTLDNWQHPLGLIETLLHSVQTGQETVINVDPKSRRQYGSHVDYASLISRNFVGMYERSKSIKIYHVASSEILTIAEIVKIFESFFPNKVKVKWMKGEESSVVLQTKYLEREVFQWTKLSEALATISKSIC